MRYQSRMIPSPLSLDSNDVIDMLPKDDHQLLLLERLKFGDILLLESEA
jgi:hypothetical protein